MRTGPLASWVADDLAVEVVKVPVGVDAVLVDHAFQHHRRLGLEGLRRNARLRAHRAPPDASRPGANASWSVR